MLRESQRSGWRLAPSVMSELKLRPPTKAGLAPSLFVAGLKACASTVELRMAITQPMVARGERWTATARGRKTSPLKG
jgi:hypothetical protein